ncbi:energy-coupling factor ABC transporter ATP-binding protein [Castellaniella sp.]|uniref:energy-coupling factor ABC transporter ATP-binding protein n=1 Tax=Castellaniella sp. TaxID=1955812 RepID=UPI00355F8102
MDELIRVHDVQVRRDDRLVLDRAGFTLSRGERLAIVGPNGAGKTTLLRTIVGLEQAAGGEITLFGENCRREAEFRSHRPRIGFLFQESDDQLFCPSVIEDVAFGPCNLGMSNDEARARAMETLRELGIDHLSERFAHRLSGGEKRLVCLAGLLAMRPEVLLLDEPTNGVDHENGERLRAALLTFSGAILLVSHDEQFVTQIATRAMALSSGVLKEAEIHVHPHVHVHPHLHVRGTVAGQSHA